MINFQKEYLKIIQQQNTKHIITEGIGIDAAFNFFTDLIPSTDSILGNSQQQAQTNIQGIMDKTVGKFATFSQPITNINTKGKKLQKNITKPYQAASNGGNVDEEIQKSAEKSSEWSKAVIVKEFQKKARSQGLKFKGLSSEALNSPQIINQERKLILQYKRDLSKHIKKLIIQDAKKGITPNMWFDVNAKPQNQKPIIFENSTIIFKTDDNKLICEQISKKTNKKYLICESIVNEAKKGDALFKALAAGLPERFHDFYLGQDGTKATNDVLIKLINGKKVNGQRLSDNERARMLSIAGQEGADFLGVKNAAEFMEKHGEFSFTKYGKTLQKDGSLTTRHKAMGLPPKTAQVKSQKVSSNVDTDTPPATNAGNAGASDAGATPATTDAGTASASASSSDTGTSPATTNTGDAGASDAGATPATTNADSAGASDTGTQPATTDVGDAGTAGAAAAGTSIKDKLKLMWTKIKQGIDKFVRFIGKIVLIAIAFIMTLMWFLIRLVIEGAKAVMKLFGKGGGGSFKGWNTCKADVDKLLGVNTALAERIAGYLSLVLVGGAIMVMTLSSSNSDTKNAQPPVKQLDMDLSLIADFEV